MSKDLSIGNLSEPSATATHDELLASSLPARTGPYRSLSAKRPRDPSHRKSVSFNDVPIVHEVPSHDAMRNANCTAFRSWTYTDATPATPLIPSFYTSQILTPFNSSSAAAQKIHANRLSSTLYSSLSSNTTASRIPDWALRSKTPKTTVTITADEISPNNDHNSTWSPPVIVVHTPDDKTARETSPGKLNPQSTYNNPYMTQHSQATAPLLSSSSLSMNNSADNSEEKKHPYRAAIIPDTEHHRTLPFTYEPVSDSTAIYTSMLSTHLITSNHSSHEQPTPSYTRTARARSATLPITITNTTTRGTDTVSITPFRAPNATPLSNGTITPTRTVLRPTTIAFQCSQPVATAVPTNNGPSTVLTNTTNTNHNPTSMVNTSSTMMNHSSAAKPPSVPTRFASSAAAAAAAHSRFSVSATRTMPNSSLVTSTIKYAFTHPTVEATATQTIAPQATANSTTNIPASIPKPPPTAYPRSRSATVLSNRRHITSSGLSHENSASGSAHPPTSLYGTTKRNPNVRQNYGSYYMHRVLLPTTIN